MATIEDLGSTHGTIVNGTRIASVTRLHDGDELALGKATMSLRAIEPPAKTELMTHVRPQKRG